MVTKGTGLYPYLHLPVPLSLRVGAAGPRVARFAFPDVRRADLAIVKWEGVGPAARIQANC